MATDTMAAQLASTVSFEQEAMAGALRGGHTDLKKHIQEVLILRSENLILSCLQDKVILAQCGGFVSSAYLGTGMQDLVVSKVFAEEQTDC